jgi:hypothetical protein
MADTGYLMLDTGWKTAPFASSSIKNPASSIDRIYFVPSTLEGALVSN